MFNYKAIKSFIKDKNAKTNIIQFYAKAYKSKSRPDTDVNRFKRE